MNPTPTPAPFGTLAQQGQAEAVEARIKAVEASAKATATTATTAAQAAETKLAAFEARLVTAEGKVEKLNKSATDAATQHAATVASLNKVITDLQATVAPPAPAPAA